MKYRKIEPALWTDEKFKTLSQNAQYLFFYLLTCPHSNSLGLFALPKYYILGDTKLLPEQLPKLFAELFREQLIEYDEKTGVIWVINFLKHNPIENPNQAKYAMTCVASLPKNPYSARVAEQLPEQYHKQLVELLRKQYREPLSIEHLTKIKIKTLPQAEAEPASLEGAFDSFWILYPKKVDKLAARKAWRQIKIPENLDAILAGVKVYALAIKNESLKHVKNPATWLNGECWKNEINPDDYKNKPEMRSPFGNETDGWINHDQ